MDPVAGGPCVISDDLLTATCTSVDRFARGRADLGDGQDTAGFGVASEPLEGIVDGGAGDDRVAGGSGDDVLTGGDGDDVLSDRAGVNNLLGGPGNDTPVRTATLTAPDAGPVDQGSAILDDGDGTDTARFTLDPGQAPSCLRTPRERRST